MATSAETWKHFPRYMMLAMGLVFAVNARFIYMAVTTFPGAASSDDFDTSNHYDQIMQAAAAQDALGWAEHASVQHGVPALDLEGPAHATLAGAHITATAERPIGTDAPLPITFHESRPGHYVANIAMPGQGQWDLKLNISANGHQVRVTRRIINQ